MTSRIEARSPVVLGVIVVLVIAAIAGAAVLSVTRSDPEPDLATPEGVAQAYFQAILDDDEEAALSLLAPDLQDRCDRRDFRHFFVADSVRVVLISSRVTADRAVVEVEIDQISEPSPFDLNGYSTPERVVMAPTVGGWEISQVPWPFFCPEGS